MNKAKLDNLHKDIIDNSPYANHYLESAKGINISKQRALKELRKHGIVNYSDFYKELGNKQTYNAESVLTWLGY